MHFVTGGSYNGKGKWVRGHYKLEELEHKWASAYREDSMMLPSPNLPSKIVLEGLEWWIKQSLESASKENVRTEWNRIIEEWLQWERSASNRRVIYIGADLTKGIVPIDAQDRLWRDVTGWIFQDIVCKAERVDLIWYGLNQTIKETV